MFIIVKIVSEYGQNRVYPVCKRAKIFATIAGTKTLTDQAVKEIKNLGFAIQVQQQPLQKSFL
tara:strand:- start:253 stop:441 length:189 start_codon:yes stop_codon:yes gene_type:complete